MKFNPYKDTEETQPSDFLIHTRGKLEPKYYTNTTLSTALNDYLGTTDYDLNTYDYSKIGWPTYSVTQLHRITVNNELLLTTVVDYRKKP